MGGSRDQIKYKGFWIRSEPTFIKYFTKNNWDIDWERSTFFNKNEVNEHISTIVSYNKKYLTGFDLPESLNNKILNQKLKYFCCYKYFKY